MSIFLRGTKSEIKENLIIKMADFIIQTGETLRKTGKVFGFSKSTVHKYMTKNLFEIDRQRFDAVRKVLDHNKAVRHIRGGMANKRKYQKVC